MGDTLINKLHTYIHSSMLQILYMSVHHLEWQIKDPLLGATLSVVNYFVLKDYTDKVFPKMKKVHCLACLVLN